MKIIISLFLILNLSACGSSEKFSPEDKIKATLTAIEVAAEERSLSKLMDNISETYSDHRGYAKNDIRRLVQLHYIRNQNIHILSVLQSLDINDGVATVELSTVMAATEEDILNSNTRLRANSHKFSIILIENEAEQRWLVDSVSWQRGWE